VNASTALRALTGQLKPPTDLAGLIAETLPLRRDGRAMNGLCPFHNDRTPSFTVYPDHYHCFGCGAHGDVYDWLMRKRGMTFRQAVAHLAGGLGQRRSFPPRPPPAAPSRSATHDRFFLELWEEGKDPGGTVVEHYLRNRAGLIVPEGAPIRFHPHCQRGPSDLSGGQEYWPAMIALMTDPLIGEPVGLHRTYLRPDGSGKAPATVRLDRGGHTVTLKAKRILGRWGVVRLVPEDQIRDAVGIAEGIENALTAMQLMAGGPVWAAGCLNCLKTFPVLPWAKSLSIFADADDSGIGIEGARICGQRWIAAGRQAAIHIPPAGLDWNDAARRRRP
jgi:hypothetical protein